MGNMRKHVVYREVLKPTIPRFGGWYTDGRSVFEVLRNI
jgi:hypothetical protein